jgi:hypothetical protein
MRLAARAHTPSPPVRVAVCLPQYSQEHRLVISCPAHAVRLYLYQTYVRLPNIREIRRGVPRYAPVARAPCSSSGARPPSSTSCSSPRAPSAPAAPGTAGEAAGAARCSTSAASSSTGDCARVRPRRSLSAAGAAAAPPPCPAAQPRQPPQRTQAHPSVDILSCS